MAPATKQPAWVRVKPSNTANKDVEKILADLKIETDDNEKFIVYQAIILGVLAAMGVMAFLDQKEPRAKRKKSELTRVGDLAKREFERVYLLKALNENDWNMTVTAHKLNMKTGSAVIQALRKVAPAEYKKARKEGLIAPGRPAENIVKK